MVAAAVVAGDGEDDNVRIDSRRREFPDAQVSALLVRHGVSQPPSRVSHPLSRVHRVENVDENTENLLQSPALSPLE
jgi:hypothetical protein